MRLRDFVSAFRTAVLILSDPKHSFKELEKKSLEEVVGFYMRMLLLIAIAAGIFSFLFSIIRALYLEIFVSIDIQYIRVINYSVSRSSSILFFYLFAGTFILFFLSILIMPFVRKLRYAELLKVLMYSLAPLLLLGWIPPTPLPFIVWSLFLLITGIRQYHSKLIKKESIDNRT